MDRITTALGYASLSDRIVHFGLGRQTPIRANRNRLAIGARQRLTNVPADQYLTISEP
jgi:ABC-type multidrug transport system fused ATPase/permease subunit